MKTNNRKNKGSPKKGDRHMRSTSFEVRIVDKVVSPNTYKLSAFFQKTYRTWMECFVPHGTYTDSLLACAI